MVPWRMLPWAEGCPLDDIGIWLSALRPLQKYKKKVRKILTDLLTLVIVAAAWRGPGALRDGTHCIALFHLEVLVLLELLLVLLGDRSRRDRDARGVGGHHTLVVVHLVLHAVLVVRELVGAGAPLGLLLASVFIGVVEVHLGLHLVPGEAVVDEHTTHVHPEATRASTKRRHPARHLLLLHIEALHLDQVLHFLARRSLVLTLHLLHGRSGGLVRLLHLELHVVKDAVEVHGVQFDRHLDSRILLEVH